MTADASLWLDCVQSKGINMELCLPVERVFDEIVTDLITAGPVEVERKAPRCPITIRENGPNSAR